MSHRSRSRIGVRRPDGETSWAVFRAVPARDTASTLTGAVVTFIDITERKRAEEELRRSEAKWRSLAENLPDSVLIVDREARIQWVSRSPPDVERKQIVGTLSHAYISPDSLDEWKARFETVLETREVTRFETRRVGPIVPAVWYETTLVPIVEAPEVRVERMLLVARDITERRAMIAGLAEKERLASIGMLSASVAHEITNPLTYVLANLDFALSDRCSPGARRTKSLIDARDGAGRMQQIVWDLRALGRAGSEELFYVDVRSVIETALRLVGPEVAKNVQVSVDCGGARSARKRVAAHARCSSTSSSTPAMRWPTSRQANLPSASAREATRTRAWSALEVSDTGVGIEPERLGRSSTRSSRRSRPAPGSAYRFSKESIERMGGRIDVESQPGRGTTFTVWLSTTRVPLPRAESSAPPR